MSLRVVAPGQDGYVADYTIHVDRALHDDSVFASILNTWVGDAADAMRRQLDKEMLDSYAGVKV